MKIKIVNKKFSQCTGEYIGRPSPLGNPYKIGEDGMRFEVIKLYRIWLEKKIEEKNEVIISELKRLAEIAKQSEGLVLVCWCKLFACHGDVIKEILLKHYA